MLFYFIWKRRSNFTSKQQLELFWIGKENRPKLEPHILLENRARSEKPS